MPAPLPAPARQNIDLIARVERALARRRTSVERMGDRIAAFFGSFPFIAAHAVAIAIWIGLNVRLVPGDPPFDPYPFPLLGLAVGVEFIFLTTFVLMNQSHQSRRQERWMHLILQIALLTERETTKDMQLLHAVCRKLGVEVAGAEVGELARETPVAELVAEIEKARGAGPAG